MTKKIWTLIFLPLTLAAIGLEFWAGLDNSDNTVPWTDYITKYVPWPVALVVFLGLVSWLVPHFVTHYHNKKTIQHQARTIDAQAELINMQKGK